MAQAAKVRAVLLVFLLLVPAAACTYEEGTDEPTLAVTTEPGPRTVLREAAAYIRDWSTSLLSPLAAEARRYCEGGGRVVVLTEEQLDAFRAATASVSAELEKDRRTKDLIARFRELATDAPSEPAVEPCDFNTY